MPQEHEQSDVRLVRQSLCQNRQRDECPLRHEVDLLRLTAEFKFSLTTQVFTCLFLFSREIELERRRRDERCPKSTSKAMCDWFGRAEAHGSRTPHGFKRAILANTA